MEESNAIPQENEQVENEFILTPDTLIAKTYEGLENVLSQELEELGAENIRKGKRMVSFTGDKELMYRANFSLRTAVRILKPVKQFKATNPDEVYDLVKTIPWEDYMDSNNSFAVDPVVYSEEFSHSKFVAYRVKDAIADYFREKEGKRLNVSVSNPDFRINIHIAGTDCMISLDSSGESLHKRGYREEAGEAPISEVLAAGIILMSGWHGECDFIDPMCGSGTFLIEADLIARNIAPGVYRQQFGFEKWRDFDADLLSNIFEDDSKERDFEHHIYGYDIDGKAVGITKCNVKSAGVGKDITVEMQDFKDFKQPSELAVIITNPPYGERLTTENLYDTYNMIGQVLKSQFKGNNAWIISSRKDCFERIGLKPSVRIPLFNGELDCELRKYQMFDGSFKDFRKEGNDIKTEGDRKFNEQKKVRQKREFNERPDRRREAGIFDGLDDVDDDFRDRYYSLNAAHRIFEDGQRQKIHHRPHFDDDEKGGFKKKYGDKKHADKKYGDKKHGERKYGDKKYGDKSYKGRGGDHKSSFNSDKNRYKK